MTQWGGVRESAGHSTQAPLPPNPHQLVPCILLLYEVLVGINVEVIQRLGGRFLHNAILPCTCSCLINVNNGENKSLP